MKVAKSKDEDDNEGVDKGGGEGGDEDGSGELIDFNPSLVGGRRKVVTPNFQILIALK